MAENDIILEMKDISKSFPGVKALDHVSIKSEEERSMHSWGRTAQANQR